MIVKLVQLGDDWAVVLDKTLLDRLQIDSSTPLEMNTDGHALIIVPADREDRQARFEAALELVNGRYGRALKRLAE
jgi:antitoxin component of MazEF toxin-antitoxin module